MRHKATHFFNVPHYANKVFEFFIALLSEKLKDRVMVSDQNTMIKIFNPLYIKSACQKTELEETKLHILIRMFGCKGQSFQNII
jgi:hypothetical protein